MRHAGEPIWIMTRNAPILFVLSVLVSGCVSVEQASNQYKANHDYESLRRLSRHIAKGMPESAVTNLLGEPAYWPTKTQCYYGSDKAVRVHEDMPPFTYVLVIQYTPSSDKRKRTVKDWDLKPVGE